MTIRHLPFFVAVAEDQHFKRAAARLNMTQSALSRRIQDFEAELGVALFERLPGGVRLTRAGAALRDDARRLLTEYERALDRARQLQRGEVGTFRVAFNGVAARHPLIPRCLNLFRAERPGIDLKLAPMVSGAQIEALLSGAIDAGFLYTPPEDLAEVASRIVFVHEFVLALPKDHPLSRRETLRLRDLQNQDFIWGSRATGWGPPAAIAYSRTRATIYDRMITACQLGGLTPRIVDEISTSEARLNLVTAGMGVCFVDDLECGREAPGIVLRQVVDFRVPLSLSLVWRRDDRSPILASFVEMVSRCEQLDMKPEAEERAVP